MDSKPSDDDTTKRLPSATSKKKKAVTALQQQQQPSPSLASTRTSSRLAAKTVQSRKAELQVTGKVEKSSKKCGKNEGMQEKEGEKIKEEEEQEEDYEDLTAYLSVSIQEDTPDCTSSSTSAQEQRGRLQGACTVPVMDGGASLVSGLLESAGFTYKGSWVQENDSMVYNNDLQGCLDTSKTGDGLVGGLASADVDYSKDSDGLVDDTEKDLQGKGDFFTGKSKCEVCGRWISSHKIQLHLRTHTGHRPYKCTECPRSFTRSDKLVSHRRTHSGERPFACFCGKRFTRADHLKVHVSVHTQEEVTRAVEILEAGDVSSDASRFVQRYKSVKTGPMVCTYCSKTFMQSYKYNRHLRVHTGAKPYVCKCGLRYSRLERLKKHQLTEGHIEDVALRKTGVISNEARLLAYVTEAKMKFELREEGQGPPYDLEIPSSKSFLVSVLERFDGIDVGGFGEGDGGPGEGTCVGEESELLGEDDSFKEGNGGHGERNALPGERAKLLGEGDSIGVKTDLLVETLSDLPTKGNDVTGPTSSKDNSALPCGSRTERTASTSKERSVLTSGVRKAGTASSPLASEEKMTTRKDVPVASSTEESTSENTPKTCGSGPSEDNIAVAIVSESDLIPQIANNSAQSQISASRKMSGDVATRKGMANACRTDRPAKTLTKTKALESISEASKLRLKSKSSVASKTNSTPESNLGKISTVSTINISQRKSNEAIGRTSTPKSASEEKVSPFLSTSKTCRVPFRSGKSTCMPKSDCIPEESTVTEDSCTISQNPAGQIGLAHRYFKDKCTEDWLEEHEQVVKKKGHGNRRITVSLSDSVEESEKSECSKSVSGRKCSLDQGTVDVTGMKKLKTGLIQSPKANLVEPSSSNRPLKHKTGQESSKSNLQEHANAPKPKTYQKSSRPNLEKCGLSPRPKNLETGLVPPKPNFENSDVSTRPKKVKIGLQSHSSNKAPGIEPRPTNVKTGLVPSKPNLENSDGSTRPTKVKIGLQSHSLKGTGISPSPKNVKAGPVPSKPNLAKSDFSIKTKYIKTHQKSDILDPTRPSAVPRKRGRPAAKRKRAMENYIDLDSLRKGEEFDDVTRTENDLSLEHGGGELGGSKGDFMVVKAGNSVLIVPRRKVGHSVCTPGGVGYSGSQHSGERVQVGDEDEVCALGGMERTHGSLHSEAKKKKPKFRSNFELDEEDVREGFEFVFDDTEAIEGFVSGGIESGRVDGRVRKVDSGRVRKGKIDRRRVRKGKIDNGRVRKGKTDSGRVRKGKIDGRRGRKGRIDIEKFGSGMVESGMENGKVKGRVKIGDGVVCDRLNNINETGVVCDTLNDINETGVVCDKLNDINETGVVYDRLNDINETVSDHILIEDRFEAVIKQNAIDCVDRLSESVKLDCQSETASSCKKHSLTAHKQSINTDCKDRTNCNKTLQLGTLQNRPKLHRKRKEKSCISPQDINAKKHCEINTNSACSLASNTDTDQVKTINNANNISDTLANMGEINYMIDHFKETDSACIFPERTVRQGALQAEPSRDSTVGFLKSSSRHKIGAVESSVTGRTSYKGSEFSEKCSRERFEFLDDSVISRTFSKASGPSKKSSSERLGVLDSSMMSRTFSKGSGLSETSSNEKLEVVDDSVTFRTFSKTSEPSESSSVEILQVVLDDSVTSRTVSEGSELSETSSSERLEFLDDSVVSRTVSKGSEIISETSCSERMDFLDDSVMSRTFSKGSELSERSSNERLQVLVSPNSSSTLLSSSKPTKDLTSSKKPSLSSSSTLTTSLEPCKSSSHILPQGSRVRGVSSTSQDISKGSGTLRRPVEPVLGSDFVGIKECDREEDIVMTGAMKTVFSSQKQLLSEKKQSLHHLLIVNRLDDIHKTDNRQLTEEQFQESTIVQKVIDCTDRMTGDKQSLPSSNCPEPRGDGSLGAVLEETEILGLRDTRETDERDLKYFVHNTKSRETGERYLRDFGGLGTVSSYDQGICSGFSRYLENQEAGFLDMEKFEKEAHPSDVEMKEYDKKEDVFLDMHRSNQYCDSRFQENKESSFLDDFEGFKEGNHLPVQQDIKKVTIANVPLDDKVSLDQEEYSSASRSPELIESSFSDYMERFKEETHPPALQSTSIKVIEDSIGSILGKDSTSSVSRCPEHKESSFLDHVERFREETHLPVQKDIKQVTIDIMPLDDKVSLDQEEYSSVSSCPEQKKSSFLNNVERFKEGNHLTVQEDIKEVTIDHIPLNDKISLNQEEYSSVSRSPEHKESTFLDDMKRFKEETHLSVQQSTSGNVFEDKIGSILGKDSTSAVSRCPEQKESSFQDNVERVKEGIHLAALQTISNKGSSSPENYSTSAICTVLDPAATSSLENMRFKEGNHLPVTKYTTNKSNSNPGKDSISIDPIATSSLENMKRLKEGTHLPPPPRSAKRKLLRVNGEYICEYCPKSFKKSHKLNIHRRTHTGERPYPCESCGKAFARKDHLVKHVAVHLKRRRESLANAGVVSEGSEGLGVVIGRYLLARRFMDGRGDFGGGRGRLDDPGGSLSGYESVFNPGEISRKSGTVLVESEVSRVDVVDVSGLERFHDSGEVSGGVQTVSGESSWLVHPKELSKGPQTVFRESACHGELYKRPETIFQSSNGLVNPEESSEGYSTDLGEYLATRSQLLLGQTGVEAAFSSSGVDRGVVLEALRAVQSNPLDTYKGKLKALETLYNVGLSDLGEGSKVSIGEGCVQRVLGDIGENCGQDAREDYSREARLDKECLQRDSTSESEEESNIATDTLMRTFEIVMLGGSDSVTHESQKTGGGADSKGFVCEICRVDFHKDEDLAKHVLAHERTLFECQHCGKEFKVRKNYEAHVLNHNLEGSDVVEIERARCNRVQCKLCGKWLVSRSSLETHLLIHSGQRPFKCEVCESGFVRKADLVRHRLVHTGHKPHVCSICGASFVRKDKLVFHLKKHS